MAQILKNIAQAAMDIYYGDFATDSDFFTIEDFITYCANTTTDLYLQEYRIKYQELRQEKSDEVVGFSHEWLASEMLEFKSEDGELVAKMKKRVMSFPFDTQGVGLQDVVAITPKGVSMERSNPTEFWQYKYLPTSNRVFWRLDGDTVRLYKNGSCTISKAKVYFVPTMDKDTEVPDAIANYVITTTVMNMKQIQAGVVIDKSADGNQNKILQTEINKSSLR